MNISYVKYVSIIYNPKRKSEREVHEKLKTKAFDLCEFLKCTSTRTCAGVRTLVICTRFM